MFELYNEDAKDRLKKIEDKSIDLIITDPPYEVSVNHDGGRMYHNKGITKSTVDLVEAKIDNGYDIESYAEEFMRIMKIPNIYLWCNEKQIPKYLEVYVGKYGLTFNILKYIKTNALPTYNNKYLTDTEYCLYFKGKGVCSPKNYEDAKTYWFEPINAKDKKIWKHPTIKPLHMIERMVRNSSKEGDKILDCFMGSGTSGVASVENERDFIGIEINKEYFEIAKSRIKDKKSEKSIIDYCE